MVFIFPELVMIVFHENGHFDAVLVNNYWWFKYISCLYEERSEKNQACLVS